MVRERDTAMGVIERLLTWLPLVAKRKGSSSVSVERNEALIDAALALATDSAEGHLEAVMQQVAWRAAALTGGAAALALIDGEGQLERFAAQGADRCTRETITKPELLGPLVARVRALGRPLGLDDLDGATARTLGAVAPHGLLAVPVGAGVSAVLLLLEPAAGEALDDDVLAAVAMLAMLAATALENVRRFATLRETCDELRHVAVEVIERRDEQLRHSAREIHDGIGQRLAAANAQLQALEPLLEGGPDAARERFRDARSLVVRVLGELRELAHALRPSLLEDFGYVPALRWYLRQLRERSGVNLSLEIEGPDIRMPFEMENALFRATEEMVGSLVRWQEAGPLRVRYRRDPETVQVEIAGPSSEPLNLGAVRERLRPFGGAVRVTSAPDAPTVIAVEVPAPVN
jgi:signal transduction histidine kinase